jgi:phthalate 4,5-cis-dihydrodiol dehydrogenase
MIRAGGAAKPALRMGIAGLGAASVNALPAIAAHPLIRISAGADLRPAAREAFARQFDAEVFDNVEALCSSANVDAVYILTPNELHAQHAIMAMERGKQVIGDKPMALTLEDCDAMLATSERNGVRLLIGHSQGLDAPIVEMARIIASGELGQVFMVNTWFYSDWLYRPRSAEELDPMRGEGLVLRQGPPQVDIVRMLCGGMGRAVRARTSSLDAARPIDGSYSAFVDFEGGIPATLVYSAYAHFDSNELTYGIGLQGSPETADLNQRTRQRLRALASPEEERAMKEAGRYPGPLAKGLPDISKRPHHAFFGITVASCERGDIRQSPNGLIIYADDGRREVELAVNSRRGQRYTTTELDLMYDAWANDKPLAAYDGRWGKATLEVCLAIKRSSAEGRGIALQHQVPYRPFELPAA